MTTIHRIRPPDVIGVFTIIHCNEDGAGPMPGSWTTLHQAIDQAESWQMQFDHHPRGNLWRYQHVVYDHTGHERYRTIIDQELLKQAEIREAWSTMIESAIRTAYTNCDTSLLPRLYHRNYLLIPQFPPPLAVGMRSIITMDVAEPALRCTLEVYGRHDRYWSIAIRSISPLT